MPKKDINLLPREEFEKKPLGHFLTWALSVGRYIVIFIELVVLLAFLSRFKFDRDLSDLYDKIQQKQAQITAYSDFETEFRLFQQRLEELNTLAKQQTPSREIIENVTQAIPDDVSLNILQLTEDQVKISGTTLSDAGLKVFVKNLSAAGKLTGLNLSSIVKKGGEGTQFMLTAKIVKEKK